MKKALPLTVKISCRNKALILKKQLCFIYWLKPMHPYAGIIRIRFSGIVSALTLVKSTPCKYVG